ncbi:IS5 family transposase [Comamonas aquatica]|nr:IS5 family transposase [Comamonas aquatica]MDH1447320.1 IS5 family transposase [Comamonas aquatica]
MRKGYPSDIKREQFEAIGPLLESARRKTAPRKVELYEVFCAVLYLLRTGCQWRALPSDFPKWRTVHSYFAIWSEPREGGSLLEQALKKSQIGAARARRGRNACSAFLIIDAQSVKNADTAGLKGYDAGKKVSGIKRHIAVDTQGLPHAVAVTTAEVTDRKGALQALKRCKLSLGRVQSLLVDSGYVGQPFAVGVQEILGGHVTVQIAKRSELHTFKVMPKRWVVERSFAWLDKNRRLWKNCERLLNTSLQFVHLAFLVLLLRRS